MRHLRGLATCGRISRGDDEALISKLLDERPGRIRNLLQGCTAASVVCAVARTHKLEKDTLHGFALDRRKRIEHLVCVLGERAAQTTHPRIGLVQQGVAASRPPQLLEHELEKRKVPRLAKNIVLYYIW